MRRSRHDIVLATGAGASTVQAWTKRARAPRVRSAWVELSALLERVVRVLEPDYVPVWLNKPAATSRWRTPSGSRAERLLELAAIVEQAARVLRPEAIPVWLNKPVPSLEQDKPIDLIARGEYRRVADVLAGLETATFS